ncbi:MAG: hypothetical protein AB8G15_22915, partial [Saprospiraceae bacterium]
MKNFTNLILLILLVQVSALAQVQVGDGTDENQAIPIEPYYGYSYTQSIYLQSEINSAGTITGLQYFYSGSSNLADTDDNIEIWIGHTTKSSFASTSDWEPIAGMTLVFSGSLPAPTTPGVDEWLSITLDASFTYNNTDNLVVAVDASEPDYDSSTDDFHCTSVGANRSMYYRNDNIDPDPASPPTGVRIGYIANIIFDGLPLPFNCADVEAPADASTISYACGGDITLEWSSTGLAPDNFDVFFGTSSGNLTLETNTTATSYTKTGLAENTTYYWMAVPKLAGVSATGCQEWSFSTGASADAGTGDMTYTFLNSKATGGPSYSWIDPVANGHTEITSMTSGSDDDGYFTVSDMGITFNYKGGDGYTDCHIGTNGYVSFEAGYTVTGGSVSIPSSSSPNNMIAGAMMDLDDRTDGRIFYATVGNTFVITWSKYYDYNDDSEWLSFQIILEGDADGGFTIQYNEAESSVSIPDFLGDAVIGAEFSSTEGALYRENGSLGPVFCSPLAVGFSHANVLLPIEMSLFEGFAMERSNMLKWETASEKNTEMHIIERSADGRTGWKMIANVPAAGWSIETQSYQVEDFNPLGMGYYRVRSVDFDASEMISEIVAIERAGSGFSIVNVFPVPTNNRLTVQFEATQA